jgi:recombinational DNA repair ATPase RecF
MLTQYKSALEEKNIILNAKNEELQSLIRILDSKLSQISSDATSKEIDFNSPHLKIMNEDLNKLHLIDIKISNLAVLISLSVGKHSI